MSENGYSKIVSWEVWNFMSIKHARCEFDDRNIINLKGYNDSGKSAMLTALKVCLTNSNPTKQVGFITDEEDYFRVLVTFSDGVMLMRDKYRNGQSLYELYKGEDLLYTTKQSNGVLTKISEVPEPIAQYLGLIEYEKTYLNFRSCFEKQIGVQTSGSENYKMFNTVLKSEEIATASTMLNNDKNKLLHEINSIEGEYNAAKNLLGTSHYITENQINYLKEHDNKLNECDKQLSETDNIKTIKDNVNSIVITPELTNIGCDELVALQNIKNTSKELRGIKIAPLINVVDDTQLKELEKINNIKVQLSDISVSPSVSEINDKQLSDLSVINNLVNSISECNNLMKENETRLNQLNTEIDTLQKKAIELGVNMVRCPNCGEIFDPETHHAH